MIYRVFTTRQAAWKSKCGLRCSWGWNLIDLIWEDDWGSSVIRQLNPLCRDLDFSDLNSANITQKQILRVLKLHLRLLPCWTKLLRNTWPTGWLRTSWSGKGFIFLRDLKLRVWKSLGFKVKTRICRLLVIYWNFSSVKIRTYSWYK